jgi:putative ABC transport system permease protein
VIRVALRGLLGRKFRTAMVALAIALGVAMVSGTYVLTDTISAAFDQIFVSSRSGSSVIVSGKKVVERSLGNQATVPESLLAKIQGLQGVESAAGEIRDDAQIVGKDGKAISTRGPPTFGYGIDFGRPRFNPLGLLSGRWPRAGEVVIDKHTASDQGFHLGEQIGISARGPVQKYRLTGTAALAGVSATGGSTLAAFDLPTAQKLFGKDGQLDSISVAAKSGVAAEQLVREIKPLLPASAQVETSTDQAQSDANQVTQGLSFLKYFLLAFAGIALFVGAFVIFNTLSITIAQRTREFATLRTIGALRRQVLESIFVEMLVVATVASLIGLAAGLGIAKGLTKLFAAAGAALPETGLVFASRTVLVSLAVGIVIAVVAGLSPALRATRVPPIAAVREGAVLPRSALARYAIPIALGVLVIALAVLGYGMFAGGVGTTTRLVLLAAGCLLLFSGVALVSPPLIRPLAAAVGYPSQRIGGIAGRLARENTVRAPGRTAATAAALMIGLALVTFVAVLGAGLRASIVDTLEQQIHADYVVTSQNGRDQFAPEAGDALTSAPGVAAGSSVRGSQAKVAGGQQTVTGIDPATIEPVFRFDWKDGSNAVLGELGRTGAVVTDTFAKDKSLKVGDRVQLITPDDRRIELTVKGIYKSSALGSALGALSLSKQLFDATFSRPQDQLALATVSGGPTDSAEQSLTRTLSTFPDAKLRTRSQFISDQESTVKTLLSLLYVLLALSVIVSLFGMVNTLALSVLERTRELGMLRAVGMTRRDVRRLVRHESVITALIGAVLGLPLGIFLAALVTRALSSQGIVFALPGRSLVLFAVIAVLAGIGAAVLPARRAARLNVLEALHYE